jgi:pimeloyl-ACP methyl ester carboxylesterase
MAELAYDTAGSGDPSVLCLHGWCCERRFFGPQVEHLSSRHRVLAVDLPGHGESAPPDEYTVEALAGDVAAFAVDAGVSGAIVIGHSLGAMVALALTACAPETVGALVLLDPPPLTTEVWKGIAAQVLPTLQGADAAAARRRFVEQMFLPTDDADRRACITEAMCAVPDDVAVAMFEAMASYDSRAALRSCGVPVLAIASAVPANDRKLLLETNPAVVTGQTVGAGHFAHLEVPDQLLPMIDRFLAKGSRCA